MTTAIFLVMAIAMMVAVSGYRGVAIGLFGVGLVATALSWLSLGNSAWAKGKTQIRCNHYEQGCAHLYPPDTSGYAACFIGCSFQCNVQGSHFCYV